jgi:glycerol-3-phosphate dehydrogenase (NAD(P)+)
MQINDDKDKREFHIGVVGGGSWGTALANLLASKGYCINLWVFEKAVKD